MPSYRKYNLKHVFDKTELFNKLDLLEVEKSGEMLITKYAGRVTKTVSVSQRYELFDFKSFIKDKIELISSNFTIHKYSLDIYGGIQEIRLYSDDVIIGDDTYTKSFYILNSTDKSRVLNINLGLYNKNKNIWAIFSTSEFSLRKKHLNGVNVAANEVTDKLDANIFDEQINAIKSLYGHSVSATKLHELIINETKSNHLKFDAFKNCYLATSNTLTNEQITILKTKSEDLKINQLENIWLDAYTTFISYVKVFVSKDSYVVKTETDKIMNITKFMVRNDKLSSIFDEEEING